MRAPLVVVTAAALALAPSAGCKKSQPGPKIVALAAGDASTCAIAEGGELWCWGLASGPLPVPTAGARAGFGDRDRREARFLTRPARVTLGAKARKVALGDSHFLACVLYEGGTVGCWGATGDLCSIDGMSGGAPMSAIRGAVDVAVGEYYACAALGDGSVKCWGSPQRHGECTKTPTTIAGLGDAVELAAGSGSSGETHVCARKKDGAVWCWGMNENGSLGRGSLEYRLETTAAEVKGVRAEQISSYGNRTCARAASGTVTCWGFGTKEKPGPTPLGGIEHAGRIAVGAAVVCAVVDGGKVRCAGANEHYQLGDTTRKDRDGPVTVYDLAGADDVAVGGGSYDTHACALAAGKVLCWGGNRWGQIGDGYAGSPSKMRSAVAW